MKATETDWRDLIVSNLEEQVVELQHPTSDLSRTEQIEAEWRSQRTFFSLSTAAMSGSQPGSSEPARANRPFTAV